MSTSYDVIVIGCGGIGSAATYWLSRAGAAVLAIEQFALGHERGESQDHSRIVRLAYHAPAYTALTRHTFSAWRTIEEESGLQLVVRTGGLDLELVDGAPRYLNHYAAAMATAAIPFETLSAAEVMARWPQFQLPESVEALYQADAGLVDARRANAAHIALARARGATIRTGTPVRAVCPVPGGIEVATDEHTYRAERLVITAGPWSNRVLQNIGLRLPLTITQEQVTYFQPTDLRAFAPERFPIWIWHGDARDCFYGLPVYGEVAIKAGQDVGGDVVTADTRTFEPNPRADADLRRFLGRYLPGALGLELYTRTCLYTLTPDRDFVIDTVPGHPQISLAVGAGHAFKFAGLIGRILSQLALDGHSAYPIAAFRLDRPALTDPSYQPAFMV
ncbi:MAG: N-methyl-L-tryptophan oxidase [Chloroflexi bacterium OHK40]